MTAAREQAAAAPPIEDDEFARLMAAVGPFEPAPALAAAVSGGADSLCLAVLLARWARARGGRVRALIVDHGLRRDSGAEAARAEARLAARGIAARILTWTGPKPDHGIQAAARTARYRLLADACRSEGLVHLALGHHRGDQCETHLLRAAAGSGPHGLAAMAAVAERRGLRLLRPLLGIAPARLRATLAAAGVAWDEDPSNRDPRFARTRLRAQAADADTEALAARIAGLGAARAADEHRIAALLARAVRLAPSGHARLDAAALTAAPEADALAALGRILCTVAGTEHPPRSARLARLLARLRAGAIGRGRTLGGCRLVPVAEGRLRVCREPAAIAPALAIAPGETALWDGRFSVRAGDGPGASGPLTVRAIDAAAWRRLERTAPAKDGAAGGRLPALVRAGLPVLCHLDCPVALPHLTRCRAAAEGRDIALAAWFTPQIPLSSAPFAAAATGDAPEPLQIC